MIDEELRTELAEIKNMISEHNLILQKLSKQISADVAIQATQAERAVELNRLRQTASQAIKLRTN
jgi:predicted  nucleic acid-binding Zn-ribbon protein